MNQRKYKILLRWFHKDKGYLVGEEQIHLTNDELARALNITERHLPYIGTCMLVRSKHVPIIELFVKHKIDLKKHSYSVGSYRITTLRQGR